MRIGIDNGISGGLVAISDHDGRIIDAEEMPVRKIGTLNAIDPSQLTAWIWWVSDGELGKIKSITIEACPEHSRQKSAMRSMAMSFGIIYGAISAHFRGTKLCVVRSGNPKDSWQRAMLPGCKAGDTKPRALALAKELWPEETFLASPRCKVPHDGLIDAALIAEYSRRMKL